jgi:hypothetical protein
MRWCARVLFIVVIVVIGGCGPGSARNEAGSDTTGSSETTTSTTSTTEADGTEATTETETESESSETESGETEEACVPGELDCECLPDGTCRPYFLGCTSGGTCQGCGFGLSIVSPPCRPDACPTDCVIELSEYGFGPLELFTIGYVQISNAQMELPYVGDACASESGWTWIVEAEQLELCGDYCDAWMQPALEGTGYDIELLCPPG